MALNNQRNHIFISYRLAAIKTRIAASLIGLNLTAEYRALLETALFSKKRQDTGAEDGSEKWGLLPGLCCQAAGGQADWVDTIAASWILFYTAADLMDSAQDQDEPAEWWKDGGPAVALSAATGLFFCAAALLSEAAFSEKTAAVAPQLTKDFHLSFLQMSSGQYADLRNTHPNLAQYQDIASQKSGSFFALACRSGARVAIQDIERINHFGEFGHSLGMLIQVLDDLEDLNSLLHSDKAHLSKSIFHSLPYIYAMQVLPQTENAQLARSLELASRDSQAALKTFDMIEKSGAVIYLLAEIERHRSRALETLTQAADEGEARALLEEFVRQLGALPQK